jgi:hypothetical protein
MPVFRPLCPNCGAATEEWPPSPGQIPPALASPPRLLTGNRTWDTVLGLLFGIVGSVATKMVPYGPLLAVPVLYFFIRPVYPYVARGLAGLMLTALALALGAVAVCFVRMAGGGH